MSDNRSCTCHPDEAPKPCQKRYAFSECQAAERIAQLEAEVKVWQGHAKTAIWSDSEECKFLTARIEQLEAALREIATYEIEDGCPCSACQHSALARAALAAPSGAMDVHSIGHMGSL